MIKIENKNFSLKQIADSGQCFRMENIKDNDYYVIANDKYLCVSEDENHIYFDCDESEYKESWKSYFDVDMDYEKLALSVDKEDTYLRNAMQFGRGIRILKQDLWEMIITFIVSQQNNIKRIRRIIGMLCTRYGRKLVSKNGTEYYSFPTAEELRFANVEELMECNLGYRAKYIVKTVEMVLHKEVDLEEIEKMKFEDARIELLKLCGIGKKVADCICLFALHQLEAFPIDTHIKQVFDAHYPAGFPFKKYKGYEGVIQQYIFYYDLKGKELMK